MSYKSSCVSQEEEKKKKKKKKKTKRHCVDTARHMKFEKDTLSACVDNQVIRAES